MNEETQGQPRTLGSDQTLGRRCAEKVRAWVDSDEVWEGELDGLDCIDKCFAVIDKMRLVINDELAKRPQPNAVGLKPARSLQNVETQHSKSSVIPCADSEGEDLG